MMDSIALAKAIDLQNQAREDRWRKNEDLFYIEYGRDPWPLLTWIKHALAGLRSYHNSIKKADRLEVSRSACVDPSHCDQAASRRA